MKIEVFPLVVGNGFIEGRCADLRIAKLLGKLSALIIWRIQPSINKSVASGFSLGVENFGCRFPALPTESPVFAKK